MTIAGRRELDRRAHTRHVVSLPALLLVGPESEPVAATVMDISLGGALVASPPGPEPGSMVLLEVRAAPLLVRLHARVAAVRYEAAEARLHLDFAASDRASLDRLASLVARLAARSGTPHDRARRASTAEPRTFRV